MWEESFGREPHGDNDAFWSCKGKSPGIFEARDESNAHHVRCGGGRCCRHLLFLSIGQNLNDLLLSRWIGVFRAHRWIRIVFRAWAEWGMDSIECSRHVTYDCSYLCEDWCSSMSGCSLLNWPSTTFSGSSLCPSPWASTSISVSRGVHWPFLEINWECNARRSVGRCCVGPRVFARCSPRSWCPRAPRCDCWWRWADTSIARAVPQMVSKVWLLFGWLNWYYLSKWWRWSRHRTTRTAVDSTMRSVDNEVLYIGRTKFADLEKLRGCLSTDRARRNSLPAKRLDGVLTDDRSDAVGVTIVEQEEGMDGYLLVNGERGKGEMNLFVSSLSWLLIEGTCALRKICEGDEGDDDEFDDEEADEERRDGIGRHGGFIRWNEDEEQFRQDCWTDWWLRWPRKVNSSSSTLLIHYSTWWKTERRSCTYSPDQSATTCLMFARHSTLDSSPAEALPMVSSHWSRAARRAISPH